ncbi:MAG: hypothetical protein IJU51_07525 [Clostridia bacterium]|nr:hypothetical protein [Clostridia bacterium]
MLKGINHSVIEVNDTGNEYYERAILMIRPEYASAQRSVLEREAKKMLRGMDAPSAVKMPAPKKIAAYVLLVSLGAVLGFVISMLAR